MGLKQPYLVFQIYVPVGQHISFEVGVSDAESTRRRLFFSSSFNDVKATPLHCQVTNNIPGAPRPRSQTQRPKPTLRLTPSYTLHPTLHTVRPTP